MRRLKSVFLIQNTELLKLFYSFVGFSFFFMLIWTLSWWLNNKFLYIKPGSDVVYLAKLEQAKTQPVFDSKKPLKILAIGDSKVLSGFVPSQFDDLVEGSSSFNAGLPGRKNYIPLLKSLIAQGEVPTHILYMTSLDNFEEPSLGFFHFISSDKHMLETFFPFYQFIRNGVVFLLRSSSFGGPKAFYAHTQGVKHEMLEKYGYHFIEDQARFPSHQLPSDFSLISDNAHLEELRSFDLSSPTFKSLQALAERYHIKILIMPTYLRKGERKEVGMHQNMIKALEPYSNFTVFAEDYWLFDTPYFSDTAHLNPGGAEMYTFKIAQLLSHSLKVEGKESAV
ncbi:MAG: hypothetical protein P1U61_01045 [Legionellaceae bacterium]|nr:hypothetical protein [Legionellaceae bacterium]